MNISQLRRGWTFFGLLTLIVLRPGIRAQEEPEKISDDSLRIPGVFKSILPGTVTKNHLRLILHPHVGDLHKHDYLRTDLGFSYGLSSRLDIAAKTRFYFGHGLKDASFGSDFGFADYFLETKYRIGKWILPGWDTAVAVSYGSPLGHPEPDTTDGLIHRETTLSFARPLETHPNIRVFWGLTTDIVTATDVVGEFEDNELSDSSQTISGGFVYVRGYTNYTFESSYATTRVWGNSNEDVYTVRPGIIFRLPSRYTFKSDGWIVGAAVPISFGPDGTDVGLSVKLRLDFDFKRMLGRHKEEQKTNKL